MVGRLIILLYMVTANANSILFEDFFPEFHLFLDLFVPFTQIYFLHLMDRLWGEF